MKGHHLGAIILIVVGMANICYGFYRVFALDKSLIPGMPVGLLCIGMGIMLITRKSDPPGNQADQDNQE